VGEWERERRGKSKSGKAEKRKDRNRRNSYFLAGNLEEDLRIFKESLEQERISLFTSLPHLLPHPHIRSPSILLICLIFCSFGLIAKSDFLYVVVLECCCCIYLFSLHPFVKYLSHIVFLAIKSSINMLLFHPSPTKLKYPRLLSATKVVVFLLADLAC
jgi:hypothetical protein